MASSAIVAILTLCALAPFTSGNPVLTQAQAEGSNAVSIQADLSINVISPEVEAAIKFLNQKSFELQKYVAAAIAQIPAETSTEAHKLDSLLQNLKQQLQKNNSGVAKQAIEAVQTIQDDLAARFAAVEKTLTQRREDLDQTAAQLREQHDQNSAQQRQQLEAESAERRAQLEEELAHKSAQLEQSFADQAEQLKRNAANLVSQLEQYWAQRHQDLAALKTNIDVQIKAGAKKTQEQIKKVTNFVQNGLLGISDTVNSSIVFKLSGIRSEVNAAVNQLNSSINNGTLHDDIAQVVAQNPNKQLKLRDILNQLAKRISKVGAAFIQTIETRLSSFFASFAGDSSQNDLNANITIEGQ